MIQEEKKYKIIKKESLEERIKQENAKEIFDCIQIGVLTTSLILAGNVISQISDPSVLYGGGLLMMFPGIFDAIKVKDLVNSITNKTYLQNQINANLENEGDLSR